MWLFAIVLVLLVAVAFLFTPTPPQKDEQKPTKLEDFTVPTADPDRFVQEIFGTVRIRAPNCLWYGDLENQKIEKSNQTVGFSYWLSMVWGICGKVDELLGFFRREEQQWTGSLTTSGETFQAWTGSTAEVYPGDKATESDVRVLFGDQESLGEYFDADERCQGIPHKGITLALMERVYVGDNVSAVDNYAFVIKRTHLLEGVDTSIEDVVGGANPAYVIWYILKEMLGIDESFIDRASFEAAATTFDDEDLGVSFVMDQAQSANKWIEDVLHHVDAVLYFDPKASGAGQRGLFKITVIRDDYVVDDLTHLTRSDYRRFVLDRQAWEDTLTEFQLRYTDPTRFKINSYSIVNAASREALGYRKKQTFDFLMFRTEEQIKNAAARMSRRNFYPLAVLDFEIAQGSFDFSPGDVVKISNPRLGISEMVIRILEVSGENFFHGPVAVRAMEDIFGIGNVAYYSTPSGTPSGSSPITEQCDKYYVYQAPQFLNDGMQQTAVFAAPPPTGTATHLKVWIDDVMQNDEVIAGYSKLEATFDAPNMRRKDGRLISAGGTLTINASGKVTFSQVHADLETGDAVIYGAFRIAWLTTKVSDTEWNAETEPGNGTGPVMTQFSNSVRNIMRCAYPIYLKNCHGVLPCALSDDEYQACERWMFSVRSPAVPIEEEFFIVQNIAHLSVGSQRMVVLGYHRNAESCKLYGSFYDQAGEWWPGSYQVNHIFWVVNGKGIPPLYPAPTGTAEAKFAAANAKFVGPSKTQSFTPSIITYLPWFPTNVNIDGYDVSWEPRNRFEGLGYEPIVLHSQPEETDVPITDGPLEDDMEWFIVDKDHPWLNWLVAVPEWTAPGPGTYWLQAISYLTEFPRNSKVVEFVIT